MDQKRFQERVYRFLRLRQITSKGFVGGLSLMRHLKLMPRQVLRLHYLCDSSIGGFGPVFRKKPTRHTEHKRARYEGFNYFRLKTDWVETFFSKKRHQGRPAPRRICLMDRPRTRGTIKRIGLHK